jgi:hypothetical protein
LYKLRQLRHAVTATVQLQKTAIRGAASRRTLAESCSRLRLADKRLHLDCTGIMFKLAVVEASKVDGGESRSH